MVGADGGGLSPLLAALQPPLLASSPLNRPSTSSSSSASIGSSGAPSEEGGAPSIATPDNESDADDVFSSSASSSNPMMEAWAAVHSRAATAGKKNKKRVVWEGLAEAKAFAPFHCTDNPANRIAVQLSTFWFWWFEEKGALVLSCASCPVRPAVCACLLSLCLNLFALCVCTLAETAAAAEEAAAKSAAASASVAAEGAAQAEENSLVEALREVRGALMTVNEDGAEVETVAAGVGLAPALLGSLRALKRRLDDSGGGGGSDSGWRLAKEVGVASREPC